MNDRSVARSILLLALVIIVAGCRAPVATPVECDGRALIGRSLRSVRTDSYFARGDLMIGSYLFVRDGVVHHGPTVPVGFPNVVASITPKRGVTAVITNPVIWIRDDVVSGAYERLDQALEAAGYDKAKNPNLK